jgi:hypothetical protein
MSSSFDLFQIAVGGKKHLRVFTIRYYPDTKGLLSVTRNWCRKRRLGDGRFAIDFGQLSLVFERYTV